MEKQTPINLINNEVKTILGTPPKWILRWGNLILLLIMIITLSGSFFFRHPEMMVGKIEIMPVKKEVKVWIPLNVTIDTVFEKDGASVAKGEPFLRYKTGGKIYTVLTPETGRMSIEQLLSKGRMIDQDSIVATIEPLNQTYAVKGIFPAVALNKIYPGQSLQIDINNYPKEDFSSLEATVITKPVQDTSGNTLITIHLNNNIHTNDGKILPIRTLAKGTGYTIVSNKRLIAWLLSK